jgi:3-phosphoshikimate 1-carboxyvinyltransferase
MKHLQVTGTICVTGSKSILQRIMLLSSVMPLKVKLEPASRCDDVMEMAAALRSIGAIVTFEANSILIDSTNLADDVAVEQIVDFKASATAFRFWLARAVVYPHKTIINISEQLHNRPFGVFLKALDVFGLITFIIPEPDKDYPHQLEISHISNSSTEVTIDSSVSSQFCSGLMLVSPLLEDGLTINFDQTPVSVDYVRLTALLMGELGVHCKQEQGRVVVPADQKYSIPTTITIEPDLSSAAFFLCLGAFSEKGISILTESQTRWQPDWRVLTILQSMGVSIVETEGLIIAKTGELHGIELDLNSNPDLVPLLVIMALFADSSSTFRNIEHLRYKESDRLAGLTKALDLLQAEYELQSVNLTVFPYDKTPDTIVLDTQNDHRLVMAFTLLHLIYPQISLSETDSVSKSCPEFNIILNSLLLGNDYCT